MKGRLWSHVKFTLYKNPLFINCFVFTYVLYAVPLNP
jgi:hypothetical protein